MAKKLIAILLSFVTVSAAHAIIPEGSDSELARTLRESNDAEERSRPSVLQYEVALKSLVLLRTEMEAVRWFSTSDSTVLEGAKRGAVGFFTVPLALGSAYVGAQFGLAYLVSVLYGDPDFHAPNSNPKGLLFRDGLFSRTRWVPTIFKPMNFALNVTTRAVSFSPALATAMASMGIALVSSAAGLTVLVTDDTYMKSLALIDEQIAELEQTIQIRGTGSLK